MSSHPHPKGPRGICAHIQPLESRFLLSHDQSTWVITASDGPDTIVVHAKTADPSILQAIVNGTVSERPAAQTDFIRIDGGAGNDSISVNLKGIFSAINLFGDAGDDTLSASSMNTDLYGGDGNDILRLNSENGSAHGEAGNDTISGNAYSDELYGGAGNDHLFGDAGDDRLHGDSGNDTLIGGADNDLLNGQAGNDVLKGAVGNDSLLGGLGNDHLGGTKGNDHLVGGFGVDTVEGHGGKDTLRGGHGSDILDGGPQADLIYHEKGIDKSRLDKLDQLKDEELIVPLKKQGDAAALKARLIDQAVQKWSYQFGRSESPSGARRYYQRGSDGKLVPKTFSWSTDFDLLGCGPSQPPPTYSYTNTQEMSVDEADLVKTNGQHLFLLDGNELVVMKAWPASETSIVSRTSIEGAPIGLYLVGKHVTVLAQVHEWVPECEGWESMDEGDTCSAGHQVSQVRAIVFDISNPGAPRLVEQTTLDGGLTTSRMIKGNLHLVMDSALNFPPPIATWHEEPPLPADWNGQTNSDWNAEMGRPAWMEVDDQRYLTQIAGEFTYETVDQYRARLQKMSLEQLLPGFTSRANGGKPQSGALLSPENLYIQGELNAMSSATSLVILNPHDRKPGIRSSTSVMGSDYTTYVTPNSLYLAASRYESDAEWNEAQVTDIYKFDMRGKAVSIVASGRAPGHLLNEYSMDEHHGLLRLATNGGAWGQTSNNVLVLDHRGQSLSLRGSVDGLAEGESIFAARFEGDKGYLVTFRRTDPLFALDLKDPDRPRVAGELKIPGFSTYLHTIDDNLVIGVGQDATETGWATGLQLSLFDVANPAKPSRLAHYTFAPKEQLGWSSSSSFAEDDPHAFAYFPESRILAIPVSRWLGYFAGHESAMAVFKIDRSGIKLLGNVPQKGAALRNVRIGEYLYTIATDALKVVELANPKNQVAEVPL